MQDNRRYVRMSTVFPVEFIIGASTAGASSGRLLQGFTRDVSEGGMCIEFKSFGKETERQLSDAGACLPERQASLDLTINPTFSHDSIRARARIIWLRKEEHSAASKYFIGVAYETIDASAQKRLISYARRMLWMPRITAALALALLAVLAGLAVHNRELVRENLELVYQLREGAGKKSEVAGELLTLADSRRVLEAELAKTREENGRLETAIAGMNAEVAQKNSYENELKTSLEREGKVRAELAAIGENQIRLRESYKRLDQSGRAGAEAVFRGMTQWLSSHQNMRTGLVASFEGDPALDDAAFTYDQALASQAFLIFGDVEHAEQVLSFFDSRAQNQAGAFYNAYDAVGGAPQENVIQSGPNLWLGIAALQHARATNRPRFVPMARRIGDWAMRLQDKEGGLPGGPGVEWHSTEHNLDAYAFFGLLHEATGDAKYAKAREAALEWLKKYAYSNKGGMVNRGKGDATIATDTFGWSIAAIGPAKLTEIGFDPEGIVDYAEKNCEVSVDFRQPDGGSVQVRGFDFAKAKNLGRGGVISTEWTAQMAVSYQVLAEYFKNTRDADKARRYLEKASFYLNELQKMIITSPSRTGQGRGCLPYASMENVDTGHGWRTPKGSSTGSVAATAYGLFAWKGYNPFEWNGEDENAVL